MRWPIGFEQASLCLALWSLAAAPVVAEGKIVVVQGPAPAQGFDNLRFGLGYFSDGALGELFGPGAAVSMGLDYALGRGFALGWDTYSLYREDAGGAHFLTLNPLQLRYRLALDPWQTPLFKPYLTLGGGASLLGLFGPPGSVPLFGLGPAGSLGLGAVVGEGLSVELGYGVGRAAGVGFQGWQFRVGTRFGEMGSLRAWGGD